MEHDLPGPGKYHLATSLLRGVESLSKKGYGSGFVSRAKRLGPAGETASAAAGSPGPGSYDPRLKAAPRRELAHSVAFSRRSQDLGPPHPPRVENRASPGPGEYQGGKKVVAGQPARAHAVFKSSTDRFKEGGNGDLKAAPGRYSLPDAFSGIQEAQYTAFKDSSKRTGRTPQKRPRGAGGLVAAATQGLASGELARLREEGEDAAPDVGPGSYTLAQQDMSVRLAIRPGKESSMFGRTRTDRFGVPVDRDPTAKDTAPRPGTYTLPGALHDAQTAVSAFASATVRGEGGAHAEWQKPPGPCFYKPRLPDKKSFHLNLKRMWV